MKRRNQRRNTLLAGAAGMAVVVALTLGLNFISFQGQGQAQSDPTPLLPTLEVTATPTVPPAPASAALQGDVLASPQLSGAASLDDWEFVDVGVRLPEDRSVWRVVNGSLLQERTAAAGNPNAYETMGLVGSSDWSSYTVRARFFDEGNGTAGLVARYAGASFYRFRLIEATLQDSPKLVLEKVIDGEATTIASSDAGSYQFRSWNEIALTVDGASLTASLNGKVVLEGEDSALTSGRAGVFTRALGEVRFNNVVVVGQ